MSEWGWRAPGGLPGTVDRGSGGLSQRVEWGHGLEEGKKEQRREEESMEPWPGGCGDVEEPRGGEVPGQGRGGRAICQSRVARPKGQS